MAECSTTESANTQTEHNKRLQDCEKNKMRVGVNLARKGKQGNERKNVSFLKSCVCLKSCVFSEMMYCIELENGRTTDGAGELLAAVGGPQLQLHG